MPKLPIPDYHPPYLGAFVEEDAPGAMVRGTRVRKVKCEPGDSTPVGTGGKVLGSVSHPDLMNGLIMYFIEWDDKPLAAVGCVAWKVGPEEGER